MSQHPQVPPSPPTDTANTRQGWFRIVDLLIPGIGMLLTGRRRVGWTMVMTWLNTLSVMAIALCYTPIHPAQALVAILIIHMTLLILGLLYHLPPPKLSPGPAVQGLGLLFAGLGLITMLLYHTGFRLVTVSDFGNFPLLLPGEVLLLHTKTAPPQRGQRMVASEGSCTAIGRVLGMPQEKISLQGFRVLINDLSIPAEFGANITVHEPLRWKPEPTRLQLAWENVLGDAYPVFYQRLAPGEETEVLLSKDQFFLVADNRSTKEFCDSRNIGPVSDFLGTPIRILWSSSTLHVRWDRMRVLWHSGSDFSSQN